MFPFPGILLFSPWIFKISFWALGFAFFCGHFLSLYLNHVGSMLLSPKEMWNITLLSFWSPGLTFWDVVSEPQNTLQSMFSLVLCFMSAYPFISSANPASFNDSLLLGFSSIWFHSAKLEAHNWLMKNFTWENLFPIIAKAKEKKNGIWSYVLLSWWVQIGPQMADWS